MIAFIQKYLEQALSEKLGIQIFSFQSSAIGCGSINDTYRIKVNHDTIFFIKINSVLKFPNLFGENDSCQIIAVRILLPVQKIAGGLDLECVTQDGGATMWGRPQPDDLGPHVNEAIVAIMGLVIKCDVERHRELIAH